jgi:hypothetical protein
MNPQEQNKAAVATPGIQKNESPKQPVAANGPADASVKPAEKTEKDAAECSTTKSSCGTK